MVHVKKRTRLSAEIWSSEGTVRRVQIREGLNRLVAPRSRNNVLFDNAADNQLAKPQIHEMHRIKRKLRHHAETRTLQN